MDNKKKRFVIFAGIVALAAVIGLLSFFLLRHTGDEPANRFMTRGTENIPLVENNPFIERMVREFQKYYSTTIQEKSTQAGIISLRDFVVGTHPANGRAVFYTIIKRAFPNYADEIMDTLARLDQYNRWLEDNKEMLARMSESERNAALWKKRHELFGDDADKIWSGDMLATDARKAKMQEALAILDKSDEMSIEDKFQVYRSSLRDTYKGTPEEFILGQGELLSKVFFSIDSVQDEFKKMGPEQRQQEINNIRKEMGFTEQQIERAEARDVDNERRWQVGYQYMQKREELEKQYQGEELEEKLKPVREQYFGNEANTIELEEKDNFFRFQRPRIYGRN